MQVGAVACLNLQLLPTLSHSTYIGFENGTREKFNVLIAHAGIKTQNSSGQHFPFSQVQV